MSMTQIWEGDKLEAVTAVSVNPCVITQVKNKDKDGYTAIQIAGGERKKKNVKKPQLSHLKKSVSNIETAVKVPRYLKEFRVDKTEAFAEGKFIDISSFNKGDIINVIGTSKGKGFQGIVKRYGFRGHKMTHGNKDQQRMSGSVGAKGPAHIFKGIRMGGRMGGDRVTTTNLEIIEVDLDNNILYIKGSVPGATNSLVMIEGKGDLKVKDSSSEMTKIEKTEEINNEVEVSAENNVEAPVSSETVEASPEVEAKETETNESSETATTASEETK